MKKILPILISATLLSGAVFAQGGDTVTYTVPSAPMKKASVWDNKPWPVSRISLRAGGFWAISSTEIGVGTDNNPYSLLDMENDLGMNRHTASALLNLNARFGRHHRIDLSYYYINRKNSTTIDRDIHFGDHDYPVDADVSAYFNTHIIRLSYGFAFISNRHVEAGALIGAHIMNFGVGLEKDGASGQASFDDRTSFTAPLPDVGLWGTYAFHRNWAVSLEAGYFGITINNIRGRLLSTSLALQYRLSEHFGIEAGYTLFNVKIDLDRPHLQSELKWRYNGPSIAAVYRFGNK